MPLLNTVPGVFVPGALTPGEADPGFPWPVQVGGWVTLDTAQQVDGAKTFTSPVVISDPSSGGLVISTDGTDTASGAFVVHQEHLFRQAWFGIYDPPNSLYYGISQSLPAPAGVAAVGGYYGGMGVVAAASGPVFGALGVGQSGNGRGNVAFTVYGTNDVETFNNVLDDGAGNMFLSGGLAQNVRTVTSSGAVGSADSTVLLNAATLTATLPTAAGIAGRVYTVKLIASGTTGTVATTSSQTIDGSTTYSLSAQYKYVTVQSDGSNWFITASN